MDWDQYFMGIAEAVAKRSKCLSHHFGAVAVNQDRCIVSTGYNGTPRGYPHCFGSVTVKELNLAHARSSTEVRCPRWIAGYQSGEGIEWCPAAHAERNVVVNAARHGASLKGCTLYVSSMSPCFECAKDIVNAGIVEMVYLVKGDYPEKGITGRQIMEKCGVKLRLME